MAIKVKQNGKWTSIYGTTDFQTNTPLGLDTTLTKPKYAAEARAVGKKIGDLTNLNTIDKKSLVNAINEVAINAGAGASLFTVNIDMGTKTANYSKNEIAAMVEENKLIMAVTTFGKVASFLFVGIHDTLEEVAVFAHTEVKSDNTVVTTFYRIYENKRVVIREMPHTNPIDLITATEGQIARVKTIDGNGHPMTWEAFDMTQADNGVLIIRVSGNSSTHTLEQISNAIALGQYVFALYADKYIPLYSINNTVAIFHLASIQEESNGLTISIDKDGAALITSTNIANLNYIPSPTTATIGQTIAVTSVNEDGAPLTWGAVNFPEAKDYEIPSFDLITQTEEEQTPEVALMSIAETDTTASSALAIKPNSAPCVVETDTSNITLALARGPINIKFQYIINDTTTLTTSAIINPIFFQEKNMFMAGLVDYVNNMPCFVFFTFEQNKITGQAKTLNEEISLDTTLTKEGQAAEAKAVGEKLLAFEGQIKEVIPETQASDAGKYLTPNSENKLEWKQFPIATEEIRGVIQPHSKTEDMTNPVGIDSEGRLWVAATEVKVDSTLTKEGQAADAKATGEAINKILPAYTAANYRQYLTPNNTGALEWTNLLLATKEYAGAVHPEEKTASMTTPVGIDAEGKLWVEATKVNVDKTLSQDGFAADAKVVGDRFNELFPEYDSVLHKEYHLIPNKEATQLVWEKLPTATLENLGIVKLDKTFTTEGAAAEAKALGLKLEELANRGGTFIVEYDDESKVLNKTFEEIVEAINNKFAVFIHYHTIYLPLIQQITNLLTFGISSSAYMFMRITVNAENVVTIDGDTLEIATKDKAGLVQPEAKSESMTYPVGIDTEGKLWTEGVELDTTVEEEGKAADAAAVRAELDNLLKLINNLNAQIQTGGLIVEDDDAGNVVVISLPPSWVLYDDNNGNVTITSGLAILPNVDDSNEGQFMRVINGQWDVASIDTAENIEF